MQKEMRRAGETVVAAGALPGVMESTVTGTGIGAAGVLSSAVGLGVTTLGIGMMMRCL